MRLHRRVGRLEKVNSNRRANTENTKYPLHGITIEGLFAKNTEPGGQTHSSNFLFKGKTGERGTKEIVEGSNQVMSARDILPKNQHCFFSKSVA